MATLTTAEAAGRLGVKVETLYAYVSRGMLTSYRSAAGRSSHFDAREVEALALRGRPRRSTQSPALDIRIETSITEIADHHVHYRGHDAVVLAGRCTFEQVAGLLWTGSLRPHGAPWAGSTFALPPQARDLDRLRIAVTLAGATAPPGLSPPATAAHLIASAVDSLPVLGDGRTPRLVLAGRAPRRATMAGRLWTRLSPRRPAPGLLAVLNAALVLGADHELAASTLAARVAASAWAGLPAVVGAGLGPFDGPLHGRASVAARALLDEAAERGAAATVASYRARRELLPGFGQPLYPEGDPRAAALLRMLDRATVPPRARRVVDEVVAEARLQARVEPNVDLALAALGRCAGWDPTAGVLVFALARMAGWCAHAMEERGERPLRFRPRAVYVGPPPGRRPPEGQGTSRRSRSS